MGGCTERSPQGRWLSNDLANNPSPCTLANFHHPLYASGNKWDTLNVKPLWSMLYKGRAEAILLGHAHRYERYARITPGGQKDRHNGIRQFIVGTGGKGEDEPQQGKNDPLMQVRKVSTLGVLRLSLKADSYSWKFVPVAGESFTDGRELHRLGQRPLPLVGHLHQLPIHPRSAWNRNSQKFISEILHSPSPMLLGILMYRSGEFRPLSYINC